MLILPVFLYVAVLKGLHYILQIGSRDGKLLFRCFLSLYLAIILSPHLLNRKSAPDCN